MHLMNANKLNVFSEKQEKEAKKQTNSEKRRKKTSRKKNAQAKQAKKRMRSFFFCFASLFSCSASKLDRLTRARENLFFAFQLFCIWRF